MLRIGVSIILELCWHILCRLPREKVAHRWHNSILLKLLLFFDVVELAVGTLGHLTLLGYDSVLIF